MSSKKNAWSTQSFTCNQWTQVRGMVRKRYLASEISYLCSTIQTTPLQKTMVFTMWHLVMPSPASNHAQIFWKDFEVCIEARAVLIFKHDPHVSQGNLCSTPNNLWIYNNRLAQIRRRHCCCFHTCREIDTRLLTRLDTQFSLWLEIWPNIHSCVIDNRIAFASCINQIEDCVHMSKLQI